MPSNPYRARGGSFGPFGGIPPGVKFLLIALATLSIGTSALSAWKSREVGAFVAQQLWFRPEDLLGGKVWQLATYTLFSPDPMGLILSALVLWMFAGTLERRWGTRRFLTFYFLSVVLAGLLTTVLSLAVPSLRAVPNAGSWTAIEALCAAFALSFPNEQILLMFVLPIQARYLIHISVAITALYALMDGRVLPSVTPMFGLVVGAALTSRAARPRQFLLRLRVWWIDRKLRARKMRVVRGLPDDDDLPQRRSGSRGSDGFLH
jgi:membrane associated rhomboid family serine protease